MVWWSAVGRVCSTCSSWPAPSGRTWRGYPCLYRARGLPNWQRPPELVRLWTVVVRVPRRCWQRCARMPPLPSEAQDGYVSQATPPKDDTQPALTAPTVPQAEPAAAKRGNGLAALALLVGAAGVAVGGWGVWQVRLLQSQDQEQRSQLVQARSQTQLLSQREQGLTERLAALPDPQE